MSLQSDTVQEVCDRVARQVRETFRNLTIYYIVHYEGQRREALAMAAQNILSHPAAETSIHMLQKARKSEESAILGTAVALKPRFFGLTSEYTILSMCTLNLAQFKTIKDTALSAWHLAWHAIDAAQYHAAPENRSDRAQDIILRRRNALQMAHANLKADVFASAMAYLQGDKNAIKRMAIARSHNALITKALHNPEFYPFVLAIEATEYGVKQIEAKRLSRKQLVPAALKLANEVGRMIDSGAIRNWLSFCEPSQDMAWRGFSKEDILGAAISTSENLHVRSTGYLVSELVEIEPKSMVAIQDNYSPFADDGFNKKLHDKAMEEIFEDVIAQGMRTNSAEPFVKIANMQNQSMTEGQILGWCAGALQAAGKMYQRGLDNGNVGEAETLAREEFRGGRHHAEWDSLRSIGQRIVLEQRRGAIITIPGLAELCAQDEKFKKIGGAVDTTIQSADYQKKIQAVREMDIAPRPAEPSVAPKGPQGPAAPAPAGPSLGGRPAGANRVRTVPPHQAQAAAKSAQDGRAGKTDTSGKNE